MTAEQKEKHKAYVKRRRVERHDEYRAKKDKYKREEVNKNGVPKRTIRTRSKKILFKTHSKLEGY